MSWIDVRHAGFLSTIQDLGRPGWTHLGVSPGGAADSLALRIGNALVGNTEGAAGIEMTLIGGDFVFGRDAWVALAGSDCQPRLCGQPMRMWDSFPVRVGDILSTGTVTVGARAYLCVYGGLDSQSRLGSQSTVVNGGWGGHEGRALISGDRLQIGRQDQAAPGFRRALPSLRDLYSGHARLRVVDGPQWDWFERQSQEAFCESEFEVTSEADRNGVRLKGPFLERRQPTRELLSEGVSAGAIQIPAGGNPLLLYCEQQTTGGYPKIANVIRADLFRLGQLRPGQRVRFERVAIEDAWRFNREQEEMCRQAVYRI